MRTNPTTEPVPETTAGEVASIRDRAVRGRPQLIFGPRPIAGRGRNAARLALAGFWLLMAGYNVAVTLPGGGEIYEGIADISWPGFNWIVSNLVQPAAVPFTVALIVWEVAIAGLVLSKGVLLRIGLVAAMIQLIGLAPFMGWYELANIPLAVWIWLLLQRDYDRSVLDLVRHRMEAEDARTPAT